MSYDMPSWLEILAVVARGFGRNWNTLWWKIDTISLVEMIYLSVVFLLNVSYL